MEKSISITSVIVLGIILLVIGFLVGYLLRPKAVAPEVKPQTCPSCLLDSKLTQNWMGFAIGQIKEISGRDLTLSSDGETLKISVSEGARIQFLGEEGSKEADFEDVKIGKKVEIQFVVIPERNLVGSIVTILP